MAGGPPELAQNVLSARDFILRFYGTLATTRAHETDYTIGTTAVSVGTNIAQRLGWMVSNTGGPNIAVGFNPAITITTGILLTSGAAWSSNWIFDLELVGRPLYAIAASSGGTLHVIENLVAGA